MNATAGDTSLDDALNDPGNEDPGAVWPVQQYPDPVPPIDENDVAHEQDEAE